MYLVLKMYFEQQQSILYLLLVAITAAAEAAISLKSYKATAAKITYTKELESFPSSKSILECLSYCATKTSCIAGKLEDDNCQLYKDLILGDDDKEEENERILVDQKLLDFESLLNSYGRALIVGGQHTGQATILDLETLTECKPYPALVGISRLDLPIGGLLANQYPIVCSGRQSAGDDPRSICEVLHDPISQSSFELDPKFFNGMGAIWNETHWWITGGKSTGGISHSDTVLISMDTEVGGVVKSGPALPYEVYGHCLTRLDYLTFVLLGGKSHEQEMQLWGFLEQIWTPGPDTNEMYFRGDLACTSFQLGGKPTVAAITGQKLEFWSKGDSQWRYGAASLPTPMKNAVLTTGKNRNQLYLVGGETDPNSVMVLDCSSGSCASSWTSHRPLTHKFEKGALIMVPDKITDCSHLTNN